MKERSKPSKTLKELIINTGFTQKRLAVQVGCTQSLISDYITGRKMPGFDKAIAMARVLNVPLKILALSLGLDVSGIPDDIERSDHDLGDPWDEE